jgi:hypothetical protein
LRVLATKVGLGTVIDLGSNDRRYWCLVKPEVNTMWIGDYTQPVSARTDMPIRPDLILDVLGISDIDQNLLAAPLPVMKFNHEADAYMITWHRRLPDRLAAEKEIWYDRQTKLPTHVSLFDEFGRTVLLASLSSHQPVQVSDLPRNQWPQLAMSYHLYFPESDATMEFNLETAWDTHAGFPKDISFRMPPPKNAAEHVIDLNEPSDSPATDRSVKSEPANPNATAHDSSAGR